MIAIIGAMKIEVDALLAHMSETEEHTLREIPFYTGKLASRPVVVCQCGVGKVMAALTTTVLLENYDIEGVINIGTAGGLMDFEEVLDVVISDRIAHHDILVPGWAVGFNDENPRCYKADPEYIRIINEIAGEHDRAWVGPIVTGESFVCEEEQVKAIKKNYPEALCTEMEGAAIAQVCDHYHVPFVVVRSLSDITLKEGNGMTFEEYAQKASARSAVWCEKFVARLAVKNA